MTPTPFCCDITSGKPEEQKEFKKLFDEASNFSWWYLERYYGYLLQDKFSCYTTLEIATKRHPNIIPLSEGIAILKEMVGEEEKETTYTEQEIDFAYLAGVFNVSGIDGLYNEIQRLKSLGKNPHDIIIEGRNQQPKP